MADRTDPPDTSTGEGREVAMPDGTHPWSYVMAVAVALGLLLVGWMLPWPDGVPFRALPDVDVPASRLLSPPVDAVVLLLLGMRMDTWAWRKGRQANVSCSLRLGLMLVLGVVALWGLYVLYGVNDFGSLPTGRTAEGLRVGFMWLLAGALLAGTLCAPGRHAHVDAGLRGWMRCSPWSWGPSLLAVGAASALVWPTEPTVVLAFGAGVWLLSFPSPSKIKDGLSVPFEDGVEVASGPLLVLSFAAICAGFPGAFERLIPFGPMGVVSGGLIGCGLARLVVAPHVVEWRHAASRGYVLPAQATRQTPPAGTS